MRSKNDSSVGSAAFLATEILVMLPMPAFRLSSDINTRKMKE
jgi:hypothetical protein